jgi:hypothetical protein
MSVLNLLMFDHIPRIRKNTHVKYANSVEGHAEILSKQIKTYGPIYRCWAGSRAVVVVSSPEAAEVNHTFI